MHILADIRLLARGGLSGIEEYTRSVINSLLKHDKENTYELFYNGLRNQPLPTEWQSSKVKNINWHIPNKLLDVPMRFLGRPYVDVFLKSDLIYSPHFNILKTNKTPRILTFHDLSFIHHPDFFNFRQRFWHWLQAPKLQAHEAAHIIADSVFTKSDIVELFGINQEKVSVIYPGINPSFKKLENDDQALCEFRDSHNLTFPFLLYLGTLEPRKNIPGIIRAFNILKENKNFKELKLILAGKPGWLYNNIEREIKTSKYNDDIILWGPVKNEDRIFLYNLAEVFVYPSFFEGFGFPPLEAQASGCPVVVSDRTSLPEIIGDSGFCVDPWRTDELINAIEELLMNQEKRMITIQKGFINNRRFLWEKTGLNLLQLFGNVR